MRSEQRTVYFCDFCNKRYLSEYWCLKHEKRCDRNPENDRACFECAHLTMDHEATIYEEFYGGGDAERKVSAFYCKKLDKYVIPPVAEHKGNAYEFGDALNEPMPKECEYQNTIDFEKEIATLPLREG